MDEQGGIAAVVHQQVGAVAVGPSQRLRSSRARETVRRGAVAEGHADWSSSGVAVLIAQVVRAAERGRWRWRSRLLGIQSL